MEIEIDPSGICAPFPIKRVYYAFKTTASRGGHAHRNLRQLAHCPVGGCTFLLDDGVTRTEIRLDAPNKALLLEGLLWREMKDFTSDCVMVVLASTHYDESDYIRDYDQFLLEATRA